MSRLAEWLRGEPRTPERRTTDRETTDFEISSAEGFLHARDDFTSYADAVKVTDDLSERSLKAARGRRK